MSKTYSLPPLSVDAAYPRSWEQRWTKKFGTYQKPIQVPAAQVEAQAAGVDYAALERATAAQAQKALIDWMSVMGDLPAAYANMQMTRIPGSDSYELRDPMLSGVRLGSPKNTLAKMIARYETLAKTAPLPERAPSEYAKAMAELQPIQVQSTYLHSVYDPEKFQRTVNTLVELMRPHAADFDAIAFRGSSGAALAYPLGFLLKKPLIHIRKELGHAGIRVEGLFGAKRIAVIDDFVSSGETIRIIVEELDSAYYGAGFARPIFAHLFLYAARWCDSEGSVRGHVGEAAEDTRIHLAYDS